jgi:hypothetical protein
VSNDDAQGSLNFLFLGPDALQLTRDEAARRLALSKPAESANDVGSGEESEATQTGAAAQAALERREQLRKAHFAQYKAQVLTAYAEMKKRRAATGALVAAPLVAKQAFSG